MIEIACAIEGEFDLPGDGIPDDVVAGWTPTTTVKEIVSQVANLVGMRKPELPRKISLAEAISIANSNYDRVETALAAEVKRDSLPVDIPSTKVLDAPWRPEVPLDSCLATARVLVGKAKVAGLQVEFKVEASSKVAVIHWISVTVWDKDSKTVTVIVPATAMAETTKWFAGVKVGWGERNCLACGKELKSEEKMCECRR